MKRTVVEDKVARKGYKSTEQIAPQPATCFGAYYQLVEQPLTLLIPKRAFHQHSAGFSFISLQSYLEITFPKIGKK